MIALNEMTIRQTFELFVPEGSVGEVRNPKSGRDKTISGYFDNRDCFLKEMRKLNGHGPGCYVTLNPVQRSLLSRASNRLRSYAEVTTADAEIQRRRFMLIDCDAKRPSGISATDQEHEAAIELATTIRERLKGEGWPDPVLADSGNGAHLLYSIDLPNDQASTDIVKGALDALAERFNTSDIQIDRTVFNAARIVKLYGTLARKGDNTPERPHRMSAILDQPAVFESVPVETLAALAASAKDKNRKQPKATAKSSTRQFDIESWIARHNLAVSATKAWNGGTLYELEICPFNPGHKREARITQSAEGAIGFQCFHNSCRDNHWHELRALLHDLPEARLWPSDAEAPPHTREPGEESSFEEEALVLDPANPLPAARLFVSKFHLVDGSRSLQHQGGVFYEFRPQSSAYYQIDEASVRADLYTFLESAKIKDEVGSLRAFKPTKNKVENVLDALRASANLAESCVSPCWLPTSPSCTPPPLEILPCQNGLLHIPTRRLIDSTPEFFTLNGVDFPFDPKAPAPIHWLNFLHQLWPDDTQSRETLQEWIAYLLTPRTNLQKILMIVGPKRSGKGTIGRVIRFLLGGRSVCGPMLSNIAEQFGLASLIGKTVAMIADARISGRADASIVTERLLSISGEDTLSIPRKFLGDWTGKLPTRFMLLTNELPRIEDASGALASRFIVLALTESFLGREDHSLIDKFIPELPGILVWALEGWDRLQQRGRLIQPSSVEELVQEFEELGSPIEAFIRDRLETGNGFEESQEQVFKVWKAWCEANGRKHSGTVQTLSKDLRAALPHVKVTRPRVLGKQIRCWNGLKLID